MRRRYLVALFVVLIIAIAGRSLWHWIPEGTIVPRRITGGSMAPNFRGPHWELACPGCNEELNVRAPSQIPGQQRITCVHCGEETLASALEYRLGDRVVIDRRVFRQRFPERFDVVAADVSAPETPVVKRIVGLPDETVELRNGEVWADDRIVRKSPSQFIASAVLVHAMHHRNPSRPQRWTYGPSSSWSVNDQRAAWAAPTDQSGEVDWLRYQHQNFGTLEGNPNILDIYQYNGEVSRELNTVRDRALSFRLEQ